MPLFRSQYNFTLGDVRKDVEDPIGPSETIPDQSIPLNVLLQRHVRGLPVTSHTPTYSDEELPDVQKMDLTERAELAQEVSKTIATYREAAKNAELAEQKKAERDQWLKEHETEQAKNSDNPKPNEPTT